MVLRLFVLFYYRRGIINNAMLKCVPKYSK